MRRLVAASAIVLGAMMVLAPAAHVLSALVSLALVAVVACMLITYEVSRYAEARERIRHAGWEGLAK